MSLFLGGLLPLLLLVFTTLAPIAQASEGIVTLPSAATLAGCQRSCGDLTFDYPFGIGSSHCFRQPDFELICDNTTQPPRLLFRNGTTKIVESTDIAYLNVAFPNVGISMKPNVSVYNMSLEPPGKSFLLSFAELNITGCDFDIYQLVLDENEYVPAKLCSVTCPNKKITEAVARQDCNGTGCCTIGINVHAHNFQLMFARKGELKHDAPSNQSSLEVNKKIPFRRNAVHDGGMEATIPPQSGNKRMFPKKSILISPPAEGWGNRRRHSRTIRGILAAAWET